ncbi:MAG: hypothetical protein ACHQIM_15540 [Sphingobacteriales bacterium]
MKKNVLIILFCCSAAIAFAQAKSDSLAYQLERAKINAMLAQRTLKFGQYDQSLSMHTGIFGFQTKKDIRRSNDILMDIVKTDDSIYRELKILFDYTVFQRTQVQDHSKEAIESNLGYMTTINKLRKQVDLLKADANAQQTRDGKTQGLLIVILVIMLLFIFYMVSGKRKRST